MSSLVILLPKEASDNRIVDAARISFNKNSNLYSDGENGKLLKYLATHGHWSPFGHVRHGYNFMMDGWDSMDFFSEANLTGFSWEINLNDGGYNWWINGSLWAWKENLPYLPAEKRFWIEHDLASHYPLAGPLLFKDAFTEVNTEAVNHFSGIMSPALNYRTFHIKVPVSTARQLVKHQRELCWNEVSRRYVTEVPSYQTPELRKGVKNVKQGSSTELIDEAGTWANIVSKHFKASSDLYDNLCNAGVAGEQARAVLPVAHFTEFYWTGSLRAFARVVAQRKTGTHAQKEASFVADEIDKHLSKEEPVTWHIAKEDYENIVNEN